LRREVEEVNTKPILAPLLLLLLCAFASAYWCTQESANVATACGGLSTGTYTNFGSSCTYPLSLSYDGDWSTFAISCTTSGGGVIITYMKPVGVLNNSIWQTKGGDAIYRNLTLPATCWGASTTNLTLRWFGDYEDSRTQFLSCYNNTDWINLTSGPTYPFAYNTFYEEAMNWSMPPIAVDSCGTYNISAANFTLFQEDNPTTLQNGTISYTASFNFGTNASQNYSYVNTNTNVAKLCINANASFSINMYLQSSVGSGYTHRYYLFNQFVNSTQRSFSLYNFNYTAGLSLLQLTVRDYYTNNYDPGILVKLQRYYPGTGTWVTVQEFLTDGFGLATFNILELSTDYKLIFLDQNNNVLATTTSMAFSCNAYTALGQGVCQLTYQLNNQSTIPAQTTLTINPVYNTSTNSINLTWSDPLGGTSTVITTVSSQTYTGTQTLCTSTQIGSSGLVNCPTSGYTGAVLVQVTVNGNMGYSQYITLNATSLGALLNPYEGAFWSGMIILVCAGFGMAVSPAAGLIAIMVGLIAIFSLGLFSAVTVTFLIVAGVLGIAVGWRLRS
jgi:hypothetical protein